MKDLEDIILILNNKLVNTILYILCPGYLYGRKGFDFYDILL